MQPFIAAYYSAKNRRNMRKLAVADLDTAEHLWGGPDNTRAFRNVLVGPPERRGEIWQAWISGGEIDLVDDALFYVLRHTSETAGRKLERWAVYGVIDIQDPLLFIHEDVLPEGVERARQATEACETDMAPIFVGCEETIAEDLRRILEKSVRGEKPLLTYEESERSHHFLWPLRDPKAAKQIQDIFMERPLFLLDGHHRLAAAKENHRLGMGDGKILSCVCSMGPSDTLILPIHRAVHYGRWTLPDAFFADLIRAGCRLEELPNLKPGAIMDYLERAKLDTPHCIALHSYAAKPTLLHLPASLSLPRQLASLSVACLDQGVLSQYTEATSIPVPSLELALEQLALDQAQAAFFLPAARPSEVRAIALSRLKMPRKSTRFVPKPALGLISRPWMTSG